MNRRQSLNRLEFNDNRVFHHKIEPIAGLQSHAVVNDRQRNFASDS